MLTWYLSSSFTAPNSGASATASFVDCANMWPGALLSLEDASTQLLLEVVSVSQSTSKAVLANRYYSLISNQGHLFASGTAAYSIGVGNATALSAGHLPLPPNNTTTFFRGDATFTILPANSTSALGTVAASPNDALQFYRGDSTWANLPYTTETSGSFTIPAAASTVTVAINSVTWGVVGQTIFVTDGTHFMFGELTTRTSNTSWVLTNRGYLGNDTSGTMATAASVSLEGPGLMTATQPGFVPAPPNNTTTFLRGDGTFAAPAGGGSGTKTYGVFTALDGNPPSSNYAVFGTRNLIPYLAFNDTTSYSTFFMGVIPEAASLGSGLIVRIHWMGATATTGNVIWRMYFERMNTDEDADSYDTVTSSAASATSGTSGIVVQTATTCTTIDSVTAGDGYRLKIDRDAANGSDTMTGDAQIVLVEVRSAA